MTIARLLEIHTVGEGVLYLVSHGYVSSAIFLSIQLTTIQKISQSQEDATTTNSSVLSKMFLEKTEALKKYVANIDFKAYRESLIASGMKEDDSDLIMFNYVDLILSDSIKNPDNVMKRFESEGCGFLQRQFGTIDIARIIQIGLAKRELLLPDFECIRDYIKKCKINEIISFISHVPTLKVPCPEGTRVLEINDLF